MRTARVIDGLLADYRDSQGIRFPETRPLQ
jgi:hypothetical protein